MASKTIAIIGASGDRRKYGNKAVRAYLAEGYTVYPVNTNEATIEGLQVYRSVADIPGEIERVSLYLHPEAGLTVLDDIVNKRPKEVFLNPGSESPELVARARALGLNVIAVCSILAIGQIPD